jgi:hypothetical protein
MSLYDEIKEVIDTIIAKHTVAKADGVVSFQEVWKIFILGTKDIVKVLNDYAHSSEDKKAAAVAALDRFYAEVIAPLDIKGIPNVVESLADKAVGSLLHTLADGLIDAVVAMLKVEE